MLRRAPCNVFGFTLFNRLVHRSVVRCADCFILLGSIHACLHSLQAMDGVVDSKEHPACRHREENTEMPLWGEVAVEQEATFAPHVRPSIGRSRPTARIIPVCAYRIARDVAV